MKKSFSHSLSSLYTNLRRSVSAGTNHLWRNGLLSTASISVMTLALSMILIMILVSILMSALVNNLKDKLDVSVYFQLDTPEEAIQRVHNTLLTLPEVKKVVYISSADALTHFKEQYKDDQTILASLSELQDNIFEASLHIGARNPEDFQFIIQFMRNQETISPLLSHIQENTDIITRLSSIIKGIRTIGIGLSILLAGIAVLICFNMIRMAIYMLREEVNIMKLVGGTNWFVRGPFLFEGLLYGLISASLSMLFFYPLIFILDPSLAQFFPGVHLFNYFTENFFLLWLMLTTIGIFLGVMSSAIAIRKYLH